MIVLFWVCLFIIFYTFFGYGIFLYFIIKLKRVFKNPYQFSLNANLPTVSLLIAATSISVESDPAVSTLIAHVFVNLCK